MKYKNLGTTDINVSHICLGTMTWGCQNTEAEAHEQMDYAHDEGINFFDTAELYAVPPQEHTQGLTETYIGSWVAKTGKRNDVILATKVAGRGLPWIDNGEPISAQRIEKAIERSLKRLQTDYIDLYQLHWPNYSYPHHGRHHAGDIDYTDINTHQAEEEILTILQALDKAVKSGKIRAFGLSNDTPWGVMKYIQLAQQHNLVRPTSVQNEYSILYRHDEPYLAEMCVHENVAYLPYSPLAAGSISGKYLNGARPEGARWSLGIDKRPNHRDTETAGHAVRAYMDIADKHGLDICQMALAFCYQRDFVTSTIIGATSMEQLKSDISAKDLTLSDEILKDIDAVKREFPVPY
tara:strand:+ start:1046 stop:2098 length:1053 start_codon:yes stop_codon:yes gene_type:complete